MNFNKLTKKQLIEQLLETRHAHEKLALALKEKEHSQKMDSYYEFFKSATDIVFGLDDTGVVKWMNQQGVNQLEYSKDDLEGSLLSRIINPDEIKLFKLALNQLLNNGKNGIEQEFSLIKKNQSLIVVKSLFQKLTTDTGEIHEIVCYCQDITKKVQAENSLRHEEENFQTLTNNLNVGVYRNTIGQDGVFFEINPAFQRIFGYRSKSELLKKNVTDLYLNPDERQQFTREITKNGYIRNREVQLVRKNGTIFTAAVSAVAIRDNKNNIRFVDGIIEDITDRKKAEEALSRQLHISSAMNKLNEVVIKENVPSVILSKMVKIVGETIKLDRARIYYIDKKKNIAESLCQWENPEAKEKISSQVIFPLEIFKKSVVELAGKKKIIESHAKAIHSALKSEGSADLIHNKMNIKSLLWLAFNINENGFHMLALNQVANARKWNKQEVDFLKAVTKQVTIAIIKSELVNELLHSEESYKGLFDSATDAIYIQDKEGKFVTVNKGAEIMYGYPREYFIGKTPEFLSAPGKNDMNLILEKFNQAFQGVPQSFLFFGIDKNGREFPKDVRLSKGAYFGQEVVVAFARDITDRINSEKAIYESQRRLVTLMGNLQGMAYRCKVDRDWTMEFVSNGSFQLTGYIATGYY